jgi:hypothetical protein
MINLAQITMVSAEYGETNGVRYENQKRICGILVYMPDCSGNSAAFTSVSHRVANGSIFSYSVRPLIQTR